MNEWGAITVIAISYIYLAARKKEESINFRLSNLIEKISVKCQFHVTKKILQNLKEDFNCYVERVNWLLENLRSIARDKCNEHEKLDRLRNLVDITAESIRIGGEEKWGNDEFLFDIRQRLKYILNAENDLDLRTILYSDIMHWAWQVVNIIDKLRELTKVENKFNRYQLLKLIDDLSEISQPSLEEELKNKNDNCICKL